MDVAAKPLHAKHEPFDETGAKLSEVFTTRCACQKVLTILSRRKAPFFKTGTHDV
jgi:hypothetical protein